MLRFIKHLFSCAVCRSKEQEVDQLRHEIDMLQSYMANQRREWAEQIERITKDCLDRVMSRSYTEYAVGTAAQAEPTPSVSRSDEEEWLLEQKCRQQIEKEVQATLTLAENKNGAG